MDNNTLLLAIFLILLFTIGFFLFLGMGLL